MRAFLILIGLCLTLTACDTLMGGVGVTIGPDGTTVSPTLSGSSGDASFTIGG
jgi:predicted small secreted protein